MSKSHRDLRMLPELKQHFTTYSVIISTQACKPVLCIKNCTCWYVIIQVSFFVKGHWFIKILHNHKYNSHAKKAELAKKASFHLKSPGLDVKSKNLFSLAYFKKQFNTILVEGHDVLEPTFLSTQTRLH